MMRPGEAHLREHYADLAARSFFPGLVSQKWNDPKLTKCHHMNSQVSYMDSGPVVAMAWEGQGAVKTGRFVQG